MNDHLMLGAEAFYLSGSPADPFVVKCQITWLGVLAVRVVDPVGVRFLDRKNVYATEFEARAVAWHVQNAGAA